MQDEAEITINGTKLTDSESMTVRVAIDMLADVMAEEADDGAGEGKRLAERYRECLVRIRSLLAMRQTRKQ